MSYTVSEPISLIEALKIILPDSSARTLRNFLKNKRVTVDGKIVVKATTILTNGQDVSINSIIKKIPGGLKVLYADKTFIIVNKPQGLLSVPLDSGKAPNIRDLLRTHYNTDDIYAVHRLDRGASGVMIYARGKESMETLKNMFEKHDFARIYFAIVEGNLTEESGTWSSRLLEFPDYSVRSIDPSSLEGKDAVTHFEVIRRSKNFTYLKLTLETGRKHQIRVQCKDAGHPITGDKRYGAIGDPVKRICLHANLLEFIHPTTGKLVSFSSPMPSCFSRLGVTN